MMLLSPDLPTDLVEGIPSELCGMPEFESSRIAARAQAGEFLMAMGSLMTQCVVFRKRLE